MAFTGWWLISVLFPSSLTLYASIYIHSKASLTQGHMMRNFCFIQCNWLMSTFENAIWKWKKLGFLIWTKLWHLIFDFQGPTKVLTFQRPWLPNQMLSMEYIFTYYLILQCHGNNSSRKGSWRNNSPWSEDDWNWLKLATTEKMILF